jgi:hypothetical protein
MGIISWIIFDLCCGDERSKRLGAGIVPPAENRRRPHFCLAGLTRHDAVFMMNGLPPPGPLLIHTLLVWR